MKTDFLFLRRIVSAVLSVGLFLSVSSVTAHAQAGKIAGRVTGQHGNEPLAGVTVINANTGVGVITDSEGLYRIKAEIGHLLRFACLGYEEKSIIVESSSDINMSLAEEVSLLDEVVVVGFGTQKKTNLTGAVSIVDKEDINGRSVANAAQALMGLDPSMNLSMNSGRASASYEIDIRGVASLNGATPLILVDGVEMDLSRVNPNDIETVSVLKDAASAAVYGAKASAGVVLITTKKGESGKVTVSYDGHYGIAANTTSTDYITNGYDWLKVTDLFFYNSNKSNSTYMKYDENDWKELEARRNDTTEDPSRPWVVTAPNGNYKYYGNFDWYGYMYKRKRSQHEHNVTVSGGNDDVRYYLSGRFFNQEGIFNIVNDPYTSFNIRGKVDIKLAKWAHLSTTFNYFNGKQTWPGLKNYEKTFYYNTFGASPIFVPRNPDGSICHVSNVQNQTAEILGGMNLMHTYGKATNLETNAETTVKNELVLDPVRGMSVHLSHAYLNTNFFGKYRATNAPYSKSEGKTVVVDTKNFLNTLEEVNQTTYKHIFEAYADYSVSVADHNIKVMGGMQYDTRRYHKNDVSVDGLLSEELSDFNIAKGETKTITGGQSEYKTLGVFGRFNYDYKGKYLLEASIRADGTSRFWSRNRWGYFPSASLGWRISEEDFWAPMKSWWNNAKLRMSVGSLGNQQVSDFLFVQTIDTGKTNGDYTLDGINKLPYAQEDNPVSGDLTWETVTTYDLGMDLAFLNNRLSFTADAYIRDTKNMMMPGASLPSVYGASEPTINAADMRTKGWEIGIIWKDLVMLGGEPMNYSVHAGVGDYKTTVTRFDNDTCLITDHYKGETLGEIWGFSVDGLFKTNEEAAAHLAEVDCSYLTAQIDGASRCQGMQAGDMKFIDLDGNGKIGVGKNTIDDHGDLKVIGNSLPRYSYNFGGNFNWRGFDFNILFQGIGKRDWYPDAGESNIFWGPYCRPQNSFLSQQLVDQIWSVDNPDGYFPLARGYEAYGTGKTYTLTTPNDRYMQSIAYLRLKNLSIGYTIPVLQKHIKRIRVYFNGDNLAYWSPLKKHCKYLDPDSIYSTTANKAGSGEVYYFSKVFSLGLNLTF